MHCAELNGTCTTEKRACDYLFSRIQDTPGIHCPSCNSTDYCPMNTKQLLNGGCAAPGSL